MERETDAGIEKLSVKYPAVLTCDLRLNVPRYATLPNIIKARKKKIEKHSPADMGVDIKPRVETLQVDDPPTRAAGIMVSDIDELVAKLKEEFADYGLTYSIGGQISFDCFPTGWDKTFCLKYLPPADFDEIHFFGDKTFEGGNDFEIFSSPRTIGHAIADADPLTTLKKLSELFGVACPSALSPPGSH